MTGSRERDSGPTPDEILNRVSQGVVALDSELRYTYVNERARQLLDREAADLLGEYVWDVFPTAAETKAKANVEEALHTGTEVSYDRYDPELERWFETTVAPDDHGITILFRDVTERKVSERQLEQLLDTTPVGVVVLRPTGDIVLANSRAEELLRLTRSEIESRTYDQPEWDIWHEDGTPITREHHPVTHVLETGDPVLGFSHGITLPDGTERWLSSNAAPIHGSGDEVERVVVAIEDVTELKRLDRLIDILQPVNDALNHARNRPAVEQQVCDQLASSALYELTWIGEYTPGMTTLDPHVCSGSATGYVDEIEIPLTGTDATGPSLRAIETGAVQVIDDIRTDPTFDPWRESALAHGLQMSAAVPLIHNETVYGTLALYTSRTDAFDEREQGLLQTLGERIGQVVHALETETLLHADRVVELTFRSTDPSSFLIEVSRQCACTIEVASTVPMSGDSVLYYAAVTGSPVTEVSEFAADTDAVESVRVLHQQDDRTGGTIELRLEGRSLAQTLMAADAVVTTDEVRDGTAEVICELTRDRSVGEIVERVTDQYPETDLVAKHEHDRSTRRETVTEAELATVFETELTDRQRQVLWAAYHAGYFQSPRQSTATEIAEVLSLTQSTLSYHLRNAQQTLLAHLFESQ